MRSRTFKGTTTTLSKKKALAVMSTFTRQLTSQAGTKSTKFTLTKEATRQSLGPFTSNTKRKSRELITMKAGEEHIINLTVMRIKKRTTRKKTRVLMMMRTNLPITGRKTMMTKKGTCLKETAPKEWEATSTLSIQLGCQTLINCRTTVMLRTRLKATQVHNRPSPSKDRGSLGKNEAKEGIDSRTSSIPVQQEPA